MLHPGLNLKESALLIERECHKVNLLIPSAADGISKMPANDFLS